MQRKHPTSYFLIVIGTLELGEERKPKNEVSLIGTRFNFLSERVCPRKQHASEKHTNNHIQTKNFSSIG